MTFGYWSLCSIGSLYIIAYVWFFILIFIQMCQIWGLKFKDKTYNLGPGLNHTLKEWQFGTVCMYSPRKSLEEKWSLLSDWKVIKLGFQLTQAENEFQRQWRKLCSDSVWDSISCGCWKQWSQAGNNCFLSCCVLIKFQIPYSFCLGIGGVLSYKELNNIPLSSWSCKGTQSLMARFWGKIWTRSILWGFFF